MVYRRLLAVLQKIRLSSPPPQLAARSRSFQIAASPSGPGSDGSFGSSKHWWGSTLGTVLVGQAVFLFMGGDCVLAQDDSVRQQATEGEQVEANVTGLRRIEDGSVISNEHTIKWRIFTDNGRDCFLKGRVEEAKKFFHLALHEAKEGFGLRDPHVASACNNLAEFYRIRKEYEKAEPLYLEAVNILEESFGADDIRVGAALHNLGQNYLAQHKLDQARTCYEVLHLEGKEKDAEALIQESIRILEEAGLGESPICIRRMKHLSMNFLRSNRLVDAESLQRKILHNLELSKGWDSLDTAAAAEALALTLQSLGNLKESEELLERCLAARKKILSEDHFQVAENLLLLARLALLNCNHLKKANSFQARAELDKAKQLLNNSIGITERILNLSRKDQRRLPSAFTKEQDQISAIFILLRSLDAVGLLEVKRHEILGRGEPFEYQETEQALRKCVSLFKEPHTLSMLSGGPKREYFSCLRRLLNIVRDNAVESQRTKLQDLIDDAQRILAELGEKNKRQ